MVFDRLQKLGKEKFQRILNELARGTPAQTLARLIQQEWHGSTLDCLDELTHIAAIQEARVFKLWEKEQLLDKPILMLNRLIRDYSKLIVIIQEMKFNLGLDEYARTIPGVTASNTNVTLPDGTTIHQQVLEAADVLNEIFDRRGIPKVQ